MLEAKDAATRLRALGMDEQATPFDRAAETPGMLYSIRLAELRGWVGGVEGAPAYGGSPLVWARVGLTAHDFAIGTNLTVPERKGSMYEPNDLAILQDVTVDGMILNAFTERQPTGGEDFPPTLLTIVVQHPGRRSSKLIKEMRRGLKPHQAGPYAVSINIDPLNQGFGNTEFRVTKLDKDLGKRVVDSVYFGSSFRDPHSEPSQKFTAILLDALTGSNLVELNHRYG